MRTAPIKKNKGLLSNVLSFGTLLFELGYFSALLLFTLGHAKLTKIPRVRASDQTGCRAEFIRSRPTVINSSNAPDASLLSIEM